MTLCLVDRVRLDRFRGFASYWEIPANHPTAEHGRWVMLYNGVRIRAESPRPCFAQVVWHTEILATMIGCGKAFTG